MNLKRNPFAMRVNIWGGLGSQLYGLNLYYILASKFPKRKIILSFHTNGVTKRNLEIPLKHNFSLKYEIEIVDDFSENQSKSEYLKDGISRLSSFFQIWIKDLLILSRFVIAINEINQISDVKRWTLNIRGHYSYLPVNEDRIGKIFEHLEHNENEFSDMVKCENCLGIHLRLGDLLKLDNKSPISSKRILNLIEGIYGEQSSNCIFHVFSDSPEEIEEYFQIQAVRKIKFKVSNCSPSETINHLCSSENFIGSTSKISIWIALARMNFRNQKSFLPAELKHIISANILHTSKIHLITFY